MFDAFYFKAADVAAHAPLMTAHVAAVRALADEVGAARGVRLGLMARVPVERADCLAMGLDVEAWLGAGRNIEASGGSLEPPGPLLEPPGPLLTHLHIIYMA